MALTQPISQETNLVGRIVNVGVTTTTLTIYAQFEDKKTGVARTPQADTKLFTLSKDTERFEMILADSHTTTDGITTITVNAAGRNLQKYGNLTGSATGNKHPIGSEIGCAEVHIPLEVLNEIIRGDEATGSAGFTIGTSAVGTITLYRSTGTSTKLGVLRWYVTSGKVEYSNDGTTWNSIDSISTSDLVVVSGADTTPGGLYDKITVTSGAGATISKAITSPGGSEKLNLTVAFDSSTLDKIANRDNSYTPAYLTSGVNVFSTHNLWTGTTDGSFQITIDGTSRSITGIDFSSATSMDDVASIIQTAIRAVTSGSETCTWSGTALIISSGLTTSSSAITVTSAGVSGTDISGAGANDYMDCDTGNGVVTAAAVNVTGDAGKIVALDTDGYIDNTLINATNTRVYTANDTWTKPSTLKFVKVRLWGAGGGGGGGGTNTSTTTYYGGTGGGGGGYHEETFLSADLPSSVSVVVGVGGAGGVGKAAGLTGPGTDGTAGGYSAFGTLAYAYGGGAGKTDNNDGFGGGGGGSLLAKGADGGTSGIRGGAPDILDWLGTDNATNATNYNNIGRGGAGSVKASDGGCAEFGGGGGGGNISGAGKNGGSSLFGGSGGGAGGWNNNANGGAGGKRGTYVAGGGGTAGTAGVAGGNGVAFGDGGGGGYGGSTGIGTAGGNGNIAGGGGGGGAAENGYAAGNGGNGGRGEVQIIEYF